MLRLGLKGAPNTGRLGCPFPAKGMLGLNPNRPANEQINLTLHALVTDLLSLHVQLRHFRHALYSVRNEEHMHPRVRVHISTLT